MASIPLGSAQIRLGNNFNQQFYYGDSNSAQLNMNNEMMRDYSNGGGAYGGSFPSYVNGDQIPFASGAQRNLGMYRGGTGRYPDLQTTNSTTAASSQVYAREDSAGPASRRSWIKVTNPNMLSTGSADPTASNVVAQYVNGGYAPTNTATNLVADFGYLEPGNYRVAYNGSSYNSGKHYCIVRGYTGEHLSGSSSNYRYILINCSWDGGWDYGHLGTSGADFTVNATYPYVILSLETHLNQNYYLNTIVSRKDTSATSYMNSNYNTNPCLWRVS